MSTYTKDPTLSKWTACPDLEPVRQCLQEFGIKHYFVTTDRLLRGTKYYIWANIDSATRDRANSALWTPNGYRAYVIYAQMWRIFRRTEEVHGCKGKS